MSDILYEGENSLRSFIERQHFNPYLPGITVPSSNFSSAEVLLFGINTHRQDYISVIKDYEENVLPKLNNTLYLDVRDSLGTIYYIFSRSDVQQIHLFMVVNLLTDHHVFNNIMDVRPNAYSWIQSDIENITE